IGFRAGVLTRVVAESGFPFFDRDTMSLKQLDERSGVRIIPGGSSVRDGCYLGKGVTIVPPAWVNIGAWVGEGTLIDSHALVGSCAQVGARVHVSAGAQIGGGAEPGRQVPVTIGDDVSVRGDCG